MKKAVLTTILMLCAASAFATIRAVSHDMYGGNANSWQVKRHNEKMSVVTNGGAKVVFVGDSITHFWESHGREQLGKYFSEGDMKMLDLGISADRTEGKGDNPFRLAEEVAKDADLVAVAVEDALEQLRGIRNRCNHLKALADVWQAIDSHR